MLFVSTVIPVLICVLLFCSQLRASQPIVTAARAREKQIQVGILVVLLFYY